MDWMVDHDAASSAKPRAYFLNLSLRRSHPMKSSVSRRTQTRENLDPEGVLRSQRRGRPPRKAFINVLVRASTRSSLSEMKSARGLASQGEVIDFLVSEIERKRAPASNR